MVDGNKCKVLLAGSFASVSRQNSECVLLLFWKNVVGVIPLRIFLFALTSTGLGSHF